ncbi:hypothetical protein DSO57_1005034 [Entomophthora muscae]|uniref:Uncharacterized protein n=1 Tax=Entomophthora muscae TaxID=34485 RepID=A0ACC2UIX7_9FUNG|nr:hypothetical protein DSO57_1005034 [Entomophthora muscae]
MAKTLEGPTRTINWSNSSSDESHQEEFMAHGWFKYPSGHWGKKFNYGCTTPLPPNADVSLVRPNAFY